MLIFAARGCEQRTAAAAALLKDKKRTDKTAIISEYNHKIGNFFLQCFQ
jgi:hypothetical protein